MSPTQWNAACMSFRHSSGGLAGGTHLGPDNRTSERKPHLPGPWYHRTVPLSTEVPWWCLWGGVPSASEPQRRAAAMHLTCSHLTCSHLMCSHLACSHLSCSRRDSKPPCGWLSRAPGPHLPGPSGSRTPAATSKLQVLHFLHCLNNTFQRSLGFLDPPMSRVAPSPPSHEHRWLAQISSLRVSSPYLVPRVPQHARLLARTLTGHLPLLGWFLEPLNIGEPDRGWSHPAMVDHLGGRPGACARLGRFGTQRTATLREHFSLLCFGGGPSTKAMFPASSVAGLTTHCC